MASFRVAGGKLQPLSAQNSAGTGTCHVAVDATGRMLIAADYTGASAASFRIENGKLSEAAWTEHYTEHGPNSDRQKTAHAHFASFSPDNRFAYINDLGGDCIHIYKPNPGDGGDDARRESIAVRPAPARARCISIPTGTPRTA